MRAKVYLQKITFYNSRIESNLERIKLYKESAENRTSNLSPNKVQTSSSKQKMADAVCAYSDLESIVKVLENNRQNIIDTISLLNPYESTVLHKCYVDGKTLWEISREMDRSYSWVTKVHSNGVKGIQEILDNKEEVG